ncbi:MAG: flagellar hook-length control protein FliK [Gammaproteobacteria bacterium]|nr:flagellar hook-length control protein FliK [Gammaproteobacteria bacterium]
MTATAISALLPNRPNSASRSRAADAGDSEAAPFASLLGSEPTAAADDAATSTVRDDADKLEDAGERDDSRVEADAQLPAWLLALRTPPAAATEAVADAAPDAAAGLFAKGRGPIAPAAIGNLRELLALKPRAGDTAPTQQPKGPLVDQAVTAAGDPAVPTVATDPALMADAVSAAAITLDAQATAALDAAIAKLDSGQPAASNAATAGDMRGLAPTAVSAAASAAPAPSPAPDLLAASATATATDAFGEPLALNGQDAALRLGERLRWLREAGVQEARLQLHPRELGSVDIRIRIEGQGASVWFGAEHPGARAALEATLPQLRERLASEGLQLSQASVGGQMSDRSGSQQQAAGDSRQPRANRADVTAAVVSGVAGGQDAPRPAAATARGGRSLIDRYA